MPTDALTEFKESQKQNWALFTPLEIFTTPCAASLVNFSKVKPYDLVLDVGCGTGVIAITAARLGAKVSAIDLTPHLIKRAQENVAVAKVEVDLKEGDVEALPYDDNSFDAVLSQFGHMFAPRPEVSIKEMLRVLKPGGTIAFSTWPPDLYVGRLFNLTAQLSPKVEGVSPPTLWGDPNFIRQQYKDAVTDLVFDMGVMLFPALSIGHYRQLVETTLGPVVKLVQDSKDDYSRLNQFRSELEALVKQYYNNNHIHQHYLMSRAKKRSTK
jgi:ubiquinone/menaquinone biosynthesis C-methylase UbiE